MLRECGTPPHRPFCWLVPGPQVPHAPLPWPSAEDPDPAHGQWSLCRPSCPHTLSCHLQPLWPSVWTLSSVSSAQAVPGCTGLPFPTLWPGNSRPGHWTVTGLTTFQRSASFLQAQDLENHCFLYFVFLLSFPAIPSIPSFPPSIVVVSSGGADWIPHISSCLKPVLLLSLF